MTTKTPTYDPDDVRWWFTTLACHLDTTPERTVRLDELWRIASDRARVVHGLAGGLAYGLLTGLLTGLTFGLLTGLTFGLLTGLVFGLENDIPSKRFARRVPGRSRWPRALVVGLVVGLTFGLAFGLVIGKSPAGLVTGIRAGLVFGLVFGLLAGLFVGLSTSSADRLRLGQDETRVIRDDLAFGLLTGLAVGLTFGPTAGLAAGLAVGPTAGPTVGLAAGLAAGRYAYSCLVFKVTGVFPARPAVFLDWARRAGLLRVAGTGYQLRHDTYQQWLVETSSEASRAGDIRSGLPWRR